MSELPATLPLLETLLASIDQAWLAGFAHLTPDARKALARFGLCFTGKSALPAALHEIEQGNYQPTQFLQLAAARAALQGAQVELLGNAVGQQLARPANPAMTISVSMLPPSSPLLSAVALWLTDIAIKGFQRAEAADLDLIESTTQQLRTEPELAPLTSLLTGWVAEMGTLVPATAGASLPLRRWVDIWCHLLLLTVALPADQVDRPVSGKLHLLGLEQRSHEQFYSLLFHGLLLGDSTAQWVKITLSAAKVNAIPPEEAALLLPDALPLFQALQKQKSLQIEQMPLRASGDLLWQPQGASNGASFKLAKLIADYLVPAAPQPFALPSGLPANAHPLHWRQPVGFTDFSVADGWLTAGSHRFRLDERRSVDTELAPANMAAAELVVGLLRYEDGALLLQPILATSKQGSVIFSGSSKTLPILLKPPKNTTVSMLQERASRLLRMS